MCIIIERTGSMVRAAATGERTNFHQEDGSQHTSWICEPSSNVIIKVKREKSLTSISTTMYSIIKVKGEQSLKSISTTCIQEND